MADKNDGADKSEMPTPKRLRDARKKGDVAKSKDLASGLLTMAWLILFALAAGYCGTRLVALADTTLRLTLTLPFASAAPAIAWEAGSTLVAITALTLVPVAMLATLAEFLQVGPILTFEKMKFSLDKLNPVEGLKRMFGMDGLFELVKTLVKVLLIGIIAYVVTNAAVEESGQLIRLAHTTTDGPGAVAASLDITWRLTMMLFALVVGVFFFVAVADRLYSKHRFIKRLKMSRRDIRQELKDDEGDPYVRSARREMHQEWANENAVGATRGAHALLVNPTHLAIALDYDPEEAPVPVIAARGAGELAAAMRAAAQEAGVPVIRHVATARTLWARGEVGEMVPQDMFDAVAAIILWARKARDGDGPMEHDMDAAMPMRRRLASEVVA